MNLQEASPDLEEEQLQQRTDVRLQFMESTGEKGRHEEHYHLFLGATMRR